jgi:hypothetical protein
LLISALPQPSDRTAEGSGRHPPERVSAIGIQPALATRAGPVLAPSEQLPSTISLRRAAHDVVDADVALNAFQIEEDAIVAYSHPELSRLVSQSPYVALKRLGGQLVKCAIDPTTIIQWELPETSLCAP